MKNLKGGVAVVTGGASGLGRAIAEEAARRGMKLVIADVEAGAMEQAVADLRAGGGEAIGVLTDVTSAASVEALAVATEQHFGPANLLFNNAGSGAPAIPLEELTAEQSDFHNIGASRVAGRGARGRGRRWGRQG